jgi:hypothetical protein
MQKRNPHPLVIVVFAGCASGAVPASIPEPAPTLSAPAPATAPAPAIIAAPTIDRQSVGKALGVAAADLELPPAPTPVDDVWSFVLAKGAGQAQPAVVALRACKPDASLCAGSVVRMPLPTAKFHGFVDLEGPPTGDLKTTDLAQAAGPMQHPALWLTSSGEGGTNLILVDVKAGRFATVLDTTLSAGKGDGPRQHVRRIKLEPGTGPVLEVHLFGESLPGKTDQPFMPGPPLRFRHAWTKAGVYERVN